MSSGSFKWPQPVERLSANLRAVDELMFKAVGGNQLGKAAAELIKTGGKRIRPALLLTSFALGDRGAGEKAIQAAAAVELAHLASLIHDDILDKGSRRRGKPSAVSVHGAAFALLLGDFLLAKALSEAAAAHEKIAHILADAVSHMAEGEALQMSGLGQFQPLSETYFKLISKKTASLFGAAAASGAICAELPANNVKGLKSYGEDFGVAFQLIDDIQDGKIIGSRKTQAIIEINARNTAAKEHLSKFTGPGMLSLGQLPDAYLDWASPL